MSEELETRVTRLEEQFKNQDKILDRISKSVDKLNLLLQQGEGAYKFIGKLIAAVALISGGIAWILTKISIIFHNT